METTFNIIDIGVGLFMTTGFILGIFSGMLRQIGRIMGLGLAFYSSLRFSDRFRRLIAPYLEEPIRNIVAYIGVFLLVYVGVYLSVFLIYKLMDKVDLTVYDRILGALFGAVKGALFSGVILIGLVVFAGESIETKIRASRSGPLLLQGTRRAVDMVPDSVSSTVRSRLDQFLHPPETEDSGTEQEQKQEQEEAASRTNTNNSSR